MALRDFSLSASVLSSTRIQFQTSNAWRNTRYFASVLMAVRCHGGAIQVEPISTRRLAAIDIAEAGAADDAAGGALDGSENDGFAPILFGGGFFYETLKVFESTHRVRNLTENIVQRILGDLPEKGTCSGRSGSSVMAEPSNLTGAAIGGVDGTEVIGISLWRGARCYEFTALRVRGKWPNWQR
jgi:hypothetical protein